MSSIEIYQRAQDVLSGHSGYGNSYWSVAANCGRQRRLADSIKIIKDGPEPDWAVRGVYYHTLLQWWHDQKIPKNSVIELNDNTLWNDAVTLFDWYRTTYARDFWGECIGTEVQFPSTPEEKAEVAKWFGIPTEYAPTMRTDLLVRADEPHVENAANHGVLLPGPGVYIVDYKHGAAHWADDEKKYTQGVQALLYLTLGNLFWAEKPKGMIFVKASMTREKKELKLKDSTYRIYTAHFSTKNNDRVKQMITYAYTSMQADMVNPYACMDCPFFNKNCNGVK